MKKLIAATFLLITFFECRVLAENAQYVCPMHPHYIVDQMGTCPICGMDLVEASSGKEQPMSKGSPEGEILYWQAPMDPGYRSDKPGKSPMGMSLVPVYAKKNDEGRGTVTIESGIIQNMGVRTEKAIVAKFGTELRSYGEVSENERKQYDVSSRVAGWIESLAVTAVGDEVKEGELLFTLYSPDLIAAQQDYRAALATGIQGRILSSAKRLVSLGVQNRTLEEIRKKQSLENMPFYAEAGGVISELNVKQGTYVKPGMQIGVIQDYSTVWINVWIAEKDLAFVSEKMSAEVTFPNLSNEVRTARIDYVYPTVDESTRTGLVRLVLDNPDGLLRPGAYADVSFETTSVKHLSIPAEAVLRSSEGSYVIIALGEGRFRPLIIKTGIYNKGRVQVLSGLKEGASVVVSGQFMIDSESSLRETFRKMKKAEMSLSDLVMDNTQMAMINHLVDSALYIHESIVDGYDIKAEMLMPAIQASDHLSLKFNGTKLKFLLESSKKALEAAQDSITESELRSSLADLLNALKPWVLEGRPEYYKDKGMKLFTDHNTGNSWLQLDAAPVNPYGDGHAMLVKWRDSSVTGEGGADAGKQ